MNARKHKWYLRIGLQSKSVLVLTTVVLGVMTAGGWLYYRATSDVLRQNDRQQADRLASGLALAVGNELANSNREPLQRLANELLGHPNVHCVYILDLSRKVMAKAESVVLGVPAFDPTYQPLSLSYETPLEENFMEVGRPIIIFDADQGENVLVGTVRLVMDTRETAHIITGVQRRIAVIAALVVLCGIPAGYVLVWRVLVVPTRRLVTVTSRLAEGDFSVRAEVKGHDEIGELAGAFNAMVERLHESQGQLRQANESLERKVAQRTAELERANHRLRVEMSEKEEFLRAVSHDLNAPLRNIAGMVQMILAGQPDRLPDQTLQRLQRVQANVETETALLADLLELSRIRTRPENRQWVETGPMLEDLRAAFEFELKQKNIALEVRGPTPALYVEANRLRQIFQNLIDNAIKYMPPASEGRITITYALLDGAHRFSVADNGLGIAPEDRQRIFCVFRRASSAAEAKVPGKGVGLAVVRSILANYDGRVWVEPNQPQGSVFHVELDVAATVGPEKDPDHHRLEAHAGQPSSC